MKHFITIAAIALTPVVANAGNMLDDFKPNAYGLGVGKNAYGQPIRHGNSRLKLNAYGHGVHKDQYGRAIRFDNNGTKIKRRSIGCTPNFSTGGCL